MKEELDIDMQELMKEEAERNSKLNRGK